MNKDRQPEGAVGGHQLPGRTHTAVAGHVLDYIFLNATSPAECQASEGPQEELSLTRSCQEWWSGQRRHLVRELGVISKQWQCLSFPSTDLLLGSVQGAL